MNSDFVVIIFYVKAIWWFINKYVLLFHLKSNVWQLFTQILYFNSLKTVCKFVGKSTKHLRILYQYLSFMFLSLVRCSLKNLIKSILLYLLFNMCLNQVMETGLFMKLNIDHTIGKKKHYRKIPNISPPNISPSQTQSSFWM